MCHSSYDLGFLKNNHFCPIFQPSASQHTSLDYGDENSVSQWKEDAGVKGGVTQTKLFNMVKGELISGY